MTDPGAPASPQTDPPLSPGTPIGATADLPGSGPGSIPPLRLRLVARIVDSVLCEAPLVGWAFAAGWIHRTHGEVSLDAPDWFLIFSTVIPVLYEWIAVGWTGRTIGKAIVGLRIVSVVDRGRPNWQQSAFRVLVPTVGEFVVLALPDADSTLAFLLSITGFYVYLTSAFHQLGRGFHDRAAATVVVRSR